MNTVEYILRPVSYSSIYSDGLAFVAFDLSAERRGEPLGGNVVQATITSPEVREREKLRFADAVVRLPSSGWLGIPRGRFAERPWVAQLILESAVADLEAFIASGLAKAPPVNERFDSPAGEAFSKEVFAVSIRAVGPDYWR